MLRNRRCESSRVASPLARPTIIILLCSLTSYSLVPMITLSYFFFFMNQVIIENITASSVRCMSPAHFGRLHFSGPCFSAWCSKSQLYDQDPWLSVSLGTSYYILFVATQGANNRPNKYFPVKYFIKYQADGAINESLVTYKEKGINKVLNYLLPQKCWKKYVQCNPRLI